MSDTITSNGVDLGETILKCKEVAASPAAITGTGQLYTKSTNRIYFRDGDGTENVIYYADINYAEMYMNANATPMAIETASTPVMTRLWTTGMVNGWTFAAGSTGAITAYADGSGTYGANTIIVTDAGHGLVTGDIISIRGTAAPNDYNGVYSITRIDNDTFWITKAGWNEDAGASDWDQGSYFKAGSGAAGLYTQLYSITVAGTSGDTITFQIYINATPCTKCRCQRKFPNGDVGEMSGSSLITIAAGDRLSVVATSDDNNDITISYGNVALHRI